METKRVGYPVAAAGHGKLTIKGMTMATIFGCSLLFWIGLAIIVPTGIYIARIKKRQARGRRDATERWTLPVAFAVLVLGVFLSADAMWQGDCIARAGNCPPNIGGSGYPCASPGAACKVLGVSSGKCVTERSSLWGCTCQCR